MAARKTLNTTNLQALGAAHLADLLMDIATGDATLKRRLRMEIAGPEQAAGEVRKRLATIKRAKSYVEWNKTKALVQDLQTQHWAIIKKIAPQAPAEALDLLWRLLELAGPLYDRCDDSYGHLGDVFYEVLNALPDIAKAAKLEPEALAEQVFAALQENDYGQYDNLIPLLAGVLGPKGIARLKSLVLALAKESVAVPAKKAHEAVGWGSNGVTYAHEVEAYSRKSTVNMALKDIAEAQGDVEAFIALYDAKTRQAPAIAADIADRLLRAGRAAEALEMLDGAKGDASRWQVWHDTRLAVLESLGRSEDTQAQRWQQFEAYLSAKDLRAYLKRLPDFDDIEAEERALDYAQGFKNLEMALHFLSNWPAAERTAALVLAGTGRLDGNAYETLNGVADLLSARHPLAATLALRAMIDFALIKARAKRYRHAARHLLECESLAAQIADFGAHPDHEVYAVSLRQKHGRKASFWQHVEGSGMPKSGYSKV